VSGTSSASWIQMSRRELRNLDEIYAGSVKAKPYTLYFTP